MRHTFIAHLACLCHQAFRNSPVHSYCKRLQDVLVGSTAQQGTEEGGSAIEKWFCDLAVYFELHARPAYKAPEGRQIDGALTLCGTIFHVEIKFIKEQMDLSQTRSFSATIVSKADSAISHYRSYPSVLRNGTTPWAYWFRSQALTMVLLRVPARNVHQCSLSITAISSA